MYGYEVPKNYDDVLRIDQENDDHEWKKCTQLEMQQLHEYSAFVDRGHINRGAKAPVGYQKIRAHLVHAVKHDGRHKARLVADRHLTPIPIEDVYSGVCSLRGVRT